MMGFFGFPFDQGNFNKGTLRNPRTKKLQTMFLCLNAFYMIGSQIDVFFFVRGARAEV